MLKNLYCQKALWYLDYEIESLKLIFNPISKNPKQVKSQIYFVPKPKEGLGIDSMGEFAISFEYSGQFVNKKGQPVPFIHITQTLETAFNFQFGDAYKSKARVFSRKPYNLTRALDYLRNLIVIVSRNNKMKKDEFSDY